MKKYSVVFIDFDGTLADSMPALYRIYCKFLEQYGIQGSEKEFLELSGPTVHEVVAILSQRYNMPNSPQALQKQYGEILRQLYASHVQPMPGALKVVQELRAQPHLKLGLVTAAVRPLVDAFLTKFELTQTFNGVVTGENIERGKPDPMIYHKALELFHVSPDNAVVIEDSENGVQSARAAGLDVIRLTDKALVPSCKQGCTEVSSWSQIENIIKQWHV